MKTSVCWKAAKSTQSSYIILRYTDKYDVINFVRKFTAQFSLNLILNYYLLNVDSLKHLIHVLEIRFS